MRGFTLIEVVTTLALVLVVSAIALPITDRLRQEGQVRGAAFAVAARCGRVRFSAVHRAARVGLRFSASGDTWVVQSFVDGDWDGVRAADIASGRDPAIDEPLPVQALFPGASFGFVDGCPLIDGTAVPAGSNPLRIGTARTLVFTPDGASSGGTLYLRGGPLASAYAVVVLAATGRTRLLRCVPGTGIWTTDAR
jgi:prepilin-type N-terminal cleavage/methylation domain-containing protein